MTSEYDDNEGSYEYMLQASYGVNLATMLSMEGVLVHWETCFITRRGASPM
jgi:hypothetical protein